MTNESNTAQLEMHHGGQRVNNDAGNWRWWEDGVSESGEGSGNLGI